MLPCDDRGRAASATLEPNALRAALDARLRGRTGRPRAARRRASPAAAATRSCASQFADGREVRSVLSAARPALRVPERESALAVATAYARLGIEHLATGLDHLLFVLGLLALLRGGRPLAARDHRLHARPQRDARRREPRRRADARAAGRDRDRREPRGAGRRAGAARRRRAARPRAPARAAARSASACCTASASPARSRRRGCPGHALPLALLSFNARHRARPARARGARAAPVIALLARAPLPRRGFLCELPATALGGIGVYLALDRAAAWLTSFT